MLDGSPVVTPPGDCFGQGVVLLYVRSTIKNNLFLGLPLHKLVFAEETAGLIQPGLLCVPRPRP